MTNIRDRRLELGMSLYDVADIVGVSKSTIFRWENDNSIIKKTDIEKLAKALRVNVEDIMGTATEHKLVRVPVYGKISAGLPILAQEDIVNYCEIADNLLPSGTSFYLNVKGNSMSPLIPDSAHVLMRLQSHLENGEIGAFLINGNDEAVLKRFKQSGDVIFLMSENSDYEPIILTKDNPVTIVGKAISVQYQL